MAEKPLPSESPAGAPAGGAPTPPTPRRGPGHRGADMRDTVAEMAERAQLISQEAGSKIAGAMKDVIAAAAGLAGFAIESARDLVQYMVRRGQMTQEEADRIIRDAEEAHGRRSPEERARPTASKVAAEAAAVARAAAAAAAAAAPPVPYTPPRMAPLTTGRAASRDYQTSRAPVASPPPRPEPVRAAPPPTPARRRAPAPASKGAAKKATPKSAAKASARSARPAAKSKAAKQSAKKGSKRR
jgi:polyhydroxyalkanoate synthesis regulator phasin